MVDADVDLLAVAWANVAVALMQDFLELRKLLVVAYGAFAREWAVLKELGLLEESPSNLLRLPACC